MVIDMATNKYELATMDLGAIESRQAVSEERRAEAMEIIDSFRPEGGFPTKTFGDAQGWKRKGREKGLTFKGGTATDHTKHEAQLAANALRDAGFSVIQVAHLMGFHQPKFGGVKVKAQAEAVEATA